MMLVSSHHMSSIQRALGWNGPVVYSLEHHSQHQRNVHCCLHHLILHRHPGMEQRHAEWSRDRWNGTGTSGIECGIV